MFTIFYACSARYASNFQRRCDMKETFCKNQYCYLKLSLKLSRKLQKEHAKLGGNTSAMDNKS
jgi:hypothetical protein